MKPWRWIVVMSILLLIFGVIRFVGVDSTPAVKLKKEAGRMQSEQKQETQIEKKSENIVTFIELGSIKCVPCKMMQPIMEEIEKEYEGQVEVVFYDVWTEEGRPYGEKYKIRAIPTQIFLDKNGKEYFRHVGFFPKEELVKVLKQQGVK